MAATSEIIGSNVKRLRVARKMNQSDLAERAGISKAGLQKIETGRVEPRTGNLMRIAAALEVDIWRLVEEQPNLRAVRFRSKKKMRTRDEVLIRVGKALRDFNDLEEVLNKKGTSKLEQIVKRVQAEKVSRDDLPLKAAGIVREELGLGEDEPIIDICDLLESAGIKLFLLVVQSDDFFGLSVASADGGPAIVVNVWDRLPVERWIFTAAHELAHLILHQDSFIVDETEENDREEAEANMFAGHFLVPDEAFLRHFRAAKGAPFIECVFKLKRIFLVSYKVILMRLVHDGIVDSTIWRRFNILFRSKYHKSLPHKEEPQGLSPDRFGLRTHDIVDRHEPHNLDQYDFVPTSLHALVREALEEKKITVGRAAEILETSVEEIQKRITFWRSLDDRRSRTSTKTDSVRPRRKRRSGLLQHKLDEDPESIRKACG